MRDNLISHNQSRLITFFACIVIAICIFGCCHARAQETIITTPVAGATHSSDQSGTVFGLFNSGTNGVAKSLYKGVGDGLAFVEGNTNGWARITLEAGYLKTKTEGSGEFATFYAPLSGTNNILGVGLGVAYLNHSLYDSTLSARLGDAVPLPMGLQKFFPLYAYIESGGGYNFQTKNGIAQAFVGTSIKYSLFRTKAGNTFDITAGYALGTISDITGTVKAIGGSLSWTW